MDVPEPTATDESTRPVDLVVVGAGVMGTWTAYWASAGGAGSDGLGGGGRRVTLLDAWGAGHSRATSGDESRISRAAHGDDVLYTRWSRRARDHWMRFEAEHRVRLWVETGVLWFAHRDDGFEKRSLATLTAEGVPAEELRADELARRWPQIGTGDDIRFAVYEPQGGSLMARRGTQAVAAALQRAGGTYALGAVRPGRRSGGRLHEVEDARGRRWSAETFVFACGPWLPKLFPDVAGDLIRVTKQDLLYVGPPPGERRFHAGFLPAWADYDAAYYGMPVLEERGFKIAPDRYGPIFDPTRGERVVDPESMRLARAYLRVRFPALADAPTVEARVCQYESTADAHFVIDRHPELENVWLVGGGSGHGFKHGPRVGEYVVARIDGAPLGAQDGPDEERFRIGTRTAKSAARTGGDEMARTWELF